MSRLAIIGTGYVGSHHRRLHGPPRPRRRVRRRRRRPRSSDSPAARCPIFEHRLDELVVEGIAQRTAALLLGRARRPSPTPRSCSSACRRPRATTARPTCRTCRPRRAQSPPRCPTSASSSTSPPCPSAATKVVERGAAPRRRARGVATPSSCARARRSTTSSTRTVWSSAATIRSRLMLVGALYDDVRRPADHHRPRVGRDHQVRVQRTSSPRSSAS